MIPSPPSIRRRFLSWDRPLLPQAVALLAADWRGDGALDLSGTLVLVPTRQAGRRLREALAVFAADRGQAVFPPRVLTLETLVVESVAVQDEATRLEAQLAWVQVFRAADLDGCRAVFPVDPPERSHAWALGLAAEFVRLQDLLAEIGLRLGDVPARVGPDFPELERWRQLAELERRQMAALETGGLRASGQARLEQLRQAELPAGVRRIVLLATPDPRPIALVLLARYAEQVPVEVVVFAPEEEAAAFDGWGRPEPDSWGKRELLAAEFERQVELCADPAAQAARLVGWAKEYAKEEGMLAVGVVDPAVFSPLESGLRREGLEGYNPEGRTRHGDRLDQLLGALAELAGDDSAVVVAGLARQPDVMQALRNREGAAFSAAKFLAELDRVLTQHLPADLPALRRHWRGGDELTVIAGWHDRLRRGSFPEDVMAVLREIFAGRSFDPANPAEADLVAAAETWGETVRAVARAAERFSGLRPAEAWETALRLYGSARVFPEKPAGALEMQGWLELIWEEAPHLVVAGFNEGCVPSTVTSDPFLPESLRVRLGLKTNAMRLATDAYYLHALAASRREGGRLELLLGRVSADGEPLRPSRLLLRCADADLPGRVRHLFRELPSAGENLAWTRAWKLRPPRVELPSRLAVTALRAWLDCPFRFYLSRGLRMEAVDAAKVELDAMDFGTLCHGALEAMGVEPALRDCTDGKQLREFLLESLDRAVTRQFGRELSLPLLVQVESARQRLGFAAEQQARLRAEGWVIERVEWKFETVVGGLTVVGKIDRIDWHETTGAIRVLDYKTSDKPVNPVQAHLRAPRVGEEWPDWAGWTENGRTRVWQDLQLPLYERVAAGHFPGAAVTCGYFNLPKAAAETEIACWAGYTPELAAAAWRCAQAVAAAIERREFWPPRELSGREAEYDDYAPLFQRGVAASVEAEALT
ncbi:MAG TPA: PD-(D/E)XK nuclease family protein [Opitutaceae bacterium]|nr:PD-(D/E)XK nuclease family protein [Opitutaceae bacterium]